MSVYYVCHSSSGPFYFHFVYVSCVCVWVLFIWKPVYEEKNWLSLNVNLSFKNFTIQTTCVRVTKNKKKNQWKQPTMNYQQNLFGNYIFYVCLTKIFCIITLFINCNALKIVSCVVCVTGACICGLSIISYSVVYLSSQHLNVMAFTSGSSNFIFSLKISQHITKKNQQHTHINSMFILGVEMIYWTFRLTYNSICLPVNLDEPIAFLLFILLLVVIKIRRKSMTHLKANFRKNKRHTERKRY